MTSTKLSQHGGSPNIFFVGAKIWVPKRSIKREDSRREDCLAAAQAAKVRNLSLTDWLQGEVKRVDRTEGEEREVLTVEVVDGGKVVHVETDGCYWMNENEEGVQDLVDSDFLHEPGVLNTLKVRYQAKDIYTFSGTILIAVNPHQPLPHLYTPQQMNSYHDKTLGERPPHVYAIAEHAFQSMLMENQRQAILISGESGAGKTESAKMVMQYLAHRAKSSKFGIQYFTQQQQQYQEQQQENQNVNKKKKVDESQAKSGMKSSRTTEQQQQQEQPGNYNVTKKKKLDGSQENQVGSSMTSLRPIEEQVLESNPLLEAFGNAKTMRNNNSSRFGKFVEMSFDDYGFVRGASISVFLLERSRVVSISDPERSYHIFYQLTKGATQEQKAKYRLKPPHKFRYLSQSNSFSLEDRDDAEEFLKTVEAMRIVGLTSEEQDSVLRIVAAILHLGDITFKALDKDSETNIENDEAEEAAINCAHLLQIDVGLLKSGLLTRKIDTPHGVIVKPLNIVGAQESRDALAKTLYSCLFDWLVGAINRKISTLGCGEWKARTIGILDIYGFESFDQNSFEQLCINLANERLQQQFNKHVLEGEQQQYINEGITWSYVEFIDNQDCLDLLEGSTPNSKQGIFPLIDEACRLPNVTNNDLAISLRSQLKSMPRFESPRRDQSAFAVEHYAGKVHYSTDQLIEKNRDYIVIEHTSIILSSQDALIRGLLNDGYKQMGQQAGSRGQLMNPNKRSYGRQQSSFKLSSVGYRFRHQLQALSDTLAECQPLYIRCIKPNPQSSPGEFVFPFVLGQLHALGVLVAVRIACSGFPTRRTFNAFVDRYYMLSRNQKLRLNIVNQDVIKNRNFTIAILQQLKLEGWQAGKTKVFLRAGQVAVLEAARGRLLNASATLIQVAEKGRQARKQYLKIRCSCLVIQSCWRGLKGRQIARQIRRERAALQIQSVFRGFVVRKQFKRLLSAVRIQRCFRRFQKAKQQRKINAAITIQKWYRRYKAQRYVMHLICALVIQKWYRRYIAMKNYRRMKAAIRLQRAWRKWLLRMGYYTDQLKVERGLMASKSSVVSKSRGRRSQRGASTRGSTHGDAWSMVSGEESESRAELTSRKITQLEKVYKEAMLDVQETQQQLESGKVDLEIEVDKWRIGYHSALAQVRSLQHEVDAIKNSASNASQTQSFTSPLATNFVYPDDLDDELSSVGPTTPTAVTPGRNSASSLDSTPTINVSQDQQAAVMALITGTTSDFLPIKPIAKTGSHFPVSSWILFRSFVHMNKNWRPEAIHTAAERLQINFKTEMLQASEIDHRLYWWSVALALAGVLSVQSKTSVAQYGLSRVANMILFVPAFHQALGKSIKQRVWTSVSIADLLQIRGSQNAWKQLIGNIEYIHGLMEKIKIPSLGARAVIRGAIQHVALELMNALLRTPDYCSNGCLRAVQDGVKKTDKAIEGLFGKEDFESFKSVWNPIQEAIQLMLQGKDELIRQNDHAMDPMPTLGRLCPSLSMGQVITLLEQSFDERESQRGVSVLKSKLDDLIRKLKKGDPFDNGDEDFETGTSLLLDSLKPFRFGCGTSEDDLEGRKLVAGAARMYANVGIGELGTTFENVELPAVILQNATLRGMFILRV